MRLKSVTMILFLVTSTAAQTPQPIPKPIGKIELVTLLVYGSAYSGLPNQVEQRGITFELDQNFFQVLADAGANDDLVSAVKAAKQVISEPVPADIGAEIAARESLVLQHLVRAKQLNPHRIHYREAEPEYRAAVLADPKNPFTHFTLGLVLSRLDRYDEAATAFRETLRLQPNSADAHLGLARALLGDNILNEAILEIKEAVRLEPENPEPHLVFAHALDMLGDKEQGAKQRQIGEALTPSKRPVGQAHAAKLVYHPDPIYPAEARSKHIEGIVRLIVILGKDGAVEDWEVESGDPLLAPAAIESVRKWRYKPSFLNNVPVEVVTEVDVNFKLAP